MKKITLLIALMIISLGFAQQQTYNVSFEPGSFGSNTGTWASFNGNLPAEVVTNPMANGVNNISTTKVLKLTTPKDAGCSAGSEIVHGTLGVWELDAAVPSNTSISFMVYKSTIGKIGFQFITKTNATSVNIINANAVSNTLINTWELITINFPAPPATLETDIDKIVFFTDWTCDVANRGAESITYIDNITFGAKKLSDPVVPTCSDGIQNGDETGVDCGGTCSPCITDPTVSAPIPTMPESEVLSVYSDTYTTNKVANFVFQDFTGGGPNTEVDIQSNGNKSAKLTNLSYYGPAFTAIDLSVEDSPGVPKYNYVHLDYYATTSSEIKFFIIDGNLGACCGDGREPRYTIKASGGDEVLVRGQWKSVFIPLSFFKNNPSLAGLIWNGNPVSQLKFEGNGNLYYDNVYFSKSNTLGTSKFETSSVKMYPNPVKNTLTIEANSEIQRVSVFNILGQEVMKASPKSNIATLQTNELQKGVYMVTTEIDGKVSTSKVVKE